MEITRLLNHPEDMDRDTLYELRSMVALHPYFQTVRLLLLQNLYLLHDPTFDEELRRATIYITDRKVIFLMIESAHYQLRNIKADSNERHHGQSTESRTATLIDTFLDSIPQDDEQPSKKKRRPTPADAAIDYVAYLLESEAQEDNTADAPQMKGQDLIDNFLEQERGRIMLSETVAAIEEEEEEQEADNEAADGNNGEEEYFTETLARIYIKQGRYQKALDITRRLSKRFPEKNAYFGDQIRFMEKLIINSKKS